MTCCWTKQSGDPCQAQALKNSKYCFWHDRESNKARVAAQRKGGRNRSNLRELRDSGLLLYNLDLRDANKCLEFINLIAHRVVTGEIDPKLASTAAHLVSTAQKINELRERQNARQLELGVPRFREPDIHELLLRSEFDVRRHVAKLTDDELQDMLERGFGTEVQMASESVVVLETCYRTTPEALEGMLIYFLNVKGRIAYERPRGQEEDQYDAQRPPATVYELLQRPEDEIKEIVGGLEGWKLPGVKGQLADLKERARFVETQLAQAHPSDRNDGPNLDAEPHKRLDGPDNPDLAVTSRNHGIESRVRAPASPQITPPLTQGTNGSNGMGQHFGNGAKSQ
jgi:hypothetical protein